MLVIKLSDVFRATMPLQSGNKGWIGVSPKGDRYHVVVPVDTQIARGVLACNLPTDGTPFGGYTGWLYYECPTFDYEGDDHQVSVSLRKERARETAEEMVKWLALYDIQAVVES